MIKLKKAVDIIQQGGIIAYPTEAVYGLGCDPFNETSVHKLCDLKQRPYNKGLILIAASWQQVEPLTQPIDKQQLQTVLASWPGPYTWIFPASETAPNWICGPQHAIALRIIDHPIAKSLCELTAKPLVSTSANLAGHEPGRTASDVKAQFGNQLDFIVDAPVGNETNPSTIRDAVTGQYLR